MHVYVDRSTIRILNALILWSKLLPSKNAEMDEFKFEMSEKDSSWQFNLDVYRLIYSSGLASKKKQKFLEIIIYYFWSWEISSTCKLRWKLFLFVKSLFLSVSLVIINQTSKFKTKMSTDRICYILFIKKEILRKKKCNILHYYNECLILSKKLKKRII